MREIRQAYTPAQFTKGGKPAAYQVGETEYVPLNNTTMVP